MVIVKVPVRSAEMDVLSTIEPVTWRDNERLAWLTYDLATWYEDEYRDNIASEKWRQENEDYLYLKWYESINSVQPWWVYYDYGWTEYLTPRERNAWIDAGGEDYFDDWWEDSEQLQATIEYYQEQDALDYFDPFDAMEFAGKRSVDRRVYFLLLHNHGIPAFRCCSRVKCMRWRKRNYGHPTTHHSQIRREQTRSIRLGRKLKAMFNFVYDDGTVYVNTI